MKRLGRLLAYAYVAMALSPLVALALYYAVGAGWALIAGRDDWYTRDAVTSPERVAELAKKGLIEQLITLPGPPAGLRKDPQTDQFDLYAIGIGQTTLPDEIQPTAMFLQGPPPLVQSPSKLKYASSSPVVGQFNNVILFEPKTGKLTPVFSDRVAVSTFRFVSGPGFELVMTLAANEDSDKDGKLSSADRQDMYLFSIVDGSLNKISGLRGHPMDIDEMPGHKFVIVRTVQDTNGDGTADAIGHVGAGGPEPVHLFRVDLTTYTAQPMIPEEMLDKLQKTLDGRAASEPAKQ